MDRIKYHADDQGITLAAGLMGEAGMPPEVLNAGGFIMAAVLYSDPDFGEAADRVIVVSECGKGTYAVALYAEAGYEDGEPPITYADDVTPADLVSTVRDYLHSDK